MKDKVEPEMITKWIDKLEPLLEEVEPKTSQASEFLENAKAYVRDSRHFMENGELVLSFEAMVWAWSIFELCKNLEIF